MGYLMYIVPIVMPVIFWGGYHYYKDRHMPEPIGNLVLCFGLGIVSFYLGKFMYMGLDLIGLRFSAYALAESSRASFLAYSVLAIGGIARNNLRQVVQAGASGVAAIRACGDRRSVLELVRLLYIEPAPQPSETAKIRSS